MERSKIKRIFWVALAVLLLVVLILVKTKFFSSKSQENFQGNTEELGLGYGNLTLEDLVKTDTDGDGILDWEESLFGTNPEKKETAPGIQDGETIKKLRAEMNRNESGNGNMADNEENLSKTDKFSRELFSAIVTLNQAGAIDQNTVDALSESLASEIENVAQEKVYSMTDIKTVGDGKEATRKYGDALNNVYSQYQIKKGVYSIFQELNPDADNSKILEELNPIINGLSKTVERSLKLEVPKTLATAHLSLINSVEKLAEDVKNMKFLESDSIRAFGAIVQYQDDAEKMQSAALKLTGAINKILETN